MESRVQELGQPQCIARRVQLRWLDRAGAVDRPRQSWSGADDVLVVSTWRGLGDLVDYM